MNDRRNNLESQVARSLAIQYTTDLRDFIGNPVLHEIMHIADSVRHHGQNYYVTGLLFKIEDYTDRKDSYREDLRHYFYRPSNKRIYRALNALKIRPGENYFDEYLTRVINDRIALLVKFEEVDQNLIKSRYIKEKKLRKKIGDKWMKAKRYLSRIIARVK